MDNIHKLRLLAQDLADEFIAMYYPTYKDYYWVGDDEFGVLDVGDDIFWSFQDIITVVNQKPTKKILQFYYEYSSYVEKPKVSLLKFLLEDNKWKPLMKAEMKLKDELNELECKKELHKLFMPEF